MIVNKRQLADILGTTEETLTQWAKQGMPILLKRLGREPMTADTENLVMEHLRAIRAATN